MFRYTENKILEILTKYVKTLIFFPLLFHNFRTCPLSH